MSLKESIKRTLYKYKDSLDLNEENSRDLIAYWIINDIQRIINGEIHDINKEYQSWIDAPVDNPPTDVLLGQMRILKEIRNILT